MESKQSIVVSLSWDGKSYSLGLLNLLEFLGQDAGEEGAESDWGMGFCSGFPAGPYAHSVRFTTLNRERLL